MRSDWPASSGAMISAHRCGAGKDVSLENTRTALSRALTLGVEYVEFDVQRCQDGTLVLYHDERVEIAGVMQDITTVSFDAFRENADHYLRYAEVLTELAASGKSAHIDFKFTSPAHLYSDPLKTYEVEAAALALDVMGPEHMIVTSLEDKSVLAVRRWADSIQAEILVGLSLGRSRAGLTKLQVITQLISEIFPARRIRHCKANLVVAHRQLARLTLRRFARRKCLPMLVWTVDEETELKYWLGPGGAWLVTTNFPELAITIRTDGR